MIELRVGVGRRIITPAIGGQLYGYNPDTRSDSVNDDLTVTAIALQYDSVKVILISVTICMVNTELAEDIRNQISKATNVPKENIILSATHTHSGPNADGATGWGGIDWEYCNNVLIPETVLASEIAIQDLKTAVMGVGTTQSDVGINRRQLNVDGKISLGQNPWGVYDSNLTVISFRETTGAPIANIIHYGTHGTAAGCNTQITRDWSGVMTDRLERETGAITAFFNGAIGDVGPRLTNGFTVGDITHVMELGGVAALHALRAYRNIKEYAKVPIDCISGQIAIPFNPRMPLEQVQKAIETYGNEIPSVNLEAQKYNYYKKVLASYESNETEMAVQETMQTIIRIGNVVFIQFPYELFSEISLRLRESSPFTHSLCLSSTNGSKGYFPSQDQICRGGYEIEMFLTNKVQTLIHNADDFLVRGSLTLLNDLYKKGEK
jgi:hypothetical protein